MNTQNMEPFDTDSYTRLIDWEFDFSDASDESLEESTSTESVPSNDFENQLLLNIQKFNMLFESHRSDLQDQINKLMEITNDVEALHRDTTIGSLSGSVIGAAGGIASIVGVALAPFTLGASLVVTGVGVGVAALGGVTGAASNIVKMVGQKTSRGKIEEIINTFTGKVNLLVDALNDIQNNITEMSGLNAQVTFEDLLHTGIRGGRALVGIPEIVRVAKVLDIGKISAQVSKTVRLATAVTGVLSGLFLVLDIVAIVSDTKELVEMDRQREDRSGENVGESQIMKFTHEMRKTARQFQEILQELHNIKKDINNMTEMPLND